ncbi:hypothetical protein DY000_02058613 [Brassica cretica]|nr:hypothetical protein DY000_02058613 [Brassica cretica]
MEGSPYRKSSISRNRGRSLGLVPGFLLAGTWSVPILGTRGSGSCLEAGGNDTGVFFPNRAYRRTSSEGERSWETPFSLLRLMLPYQARAPRCCPPRRRSEHPWHFLAPESTLLVSCRVKGLVLVSEGKILRFELAELLGALLQLLGVFVDLFLQDLELRGKLGIGLFPSSMQPGYLTLQIVDLPMEFSFSLGSFG